MITVQPTFVTAAISGIWSGTGMAWFAARENARENADAVFLLVALLFFFIPVYLFVFGREDQRFRGLADKTPGERHLILAKRGIVWFVCAALSMLVAGPLIFKVRISLQ